LELAHTATSRDVAVDYLRAFVAVLVVAIHTVPAYGLNIPEAADHRALHWLAIPPIVDSHRLIGFDLLTLFIDIFVMSLMFFLSGLFVASSLAHKDSGGFLRDRALRLGVPFIVMTLLSPLAYYPAYRVTAVDPGALAFWREWLSLGIWPNGPLWFVWVLLGFDVIAAALHRLAPGLIKVVGRFTLGGHQHPVAVFAALMLASATAYLPLQAVFGPYNWAGVGPFFVQSSRVLHYLVYFLAGAAIGGCEIGHGLLAPDGRLVRQWSRWTFGALVLFVAYVAILAQLYRTANGLAQLALGLGFVLCCGAMSFAMLAVFRRFARARTPVLDSLSRNAYGIYLLHYGFVLWLQFALLPMAIPAVAKAAIVLSAAVVASWMTTAALRLIPDVAKVI
jgi:peptidoglycan/LPS O-acetylase OafA/YrhL